MSINVNLDDFDDYGYTDTNTYIPINVFTFDDYDYDYTCNTYIPSPDSSPCMDTWTVNKYFVVVVYTLVFILNIVGNSLVILVISYNKLKRSSTDVYLLNLAIADLLFAFTLPFWAAYKAHQWVFGIPMCKIISMLQEVNFYGGILLLACISVDRYLAIVRATETITQNRYSVKYISLVIWIISFIISLPTIWFKDVFLTTENGRVCHENIGEYTEKGMIILRIRRHIVGFFIPLLIMLFCYGFTIKTLFQEKNNQNHRAMKVIFAVVLAFLICWLPYNITIIVDLLMRTNYINETCAIRDQLNVALPVTEIIGYTHSCINPILYAFIGQEFRQSFLKILASKGIISKDMVCLHGRSSSIMSTSGDTSTTL